MGRTVAIDEASVAPLPVYYVWSFPGSPVKIQLGLDAVERLQKQLPHPEDDAGKLGLLLGSIEGSTTEVRDFKCVSAQDLPGELAASLAAPLELSPVGYYRIRHDGILRLTDEDLVLAETAFSNPHHVFLLIQTNDSGPATATFFFWDEGRICGDFSFLEFPFDATLLAAAEQQRIETARLKAKPAVMVAEASDHSGKRRKSRRNAILGLAVFLLSGAVGGGVVWKLGLLPSGLNFRAAKSAAPVSVPAAPGSIGLQAERHNGDLKLTWDRQSPLIGSAISGTLVIEDGAAKREIRLDAGMVHSGSLLYSPVGDQIQMQLTVEGPQQQTTTETVLVLLSNPGTPQSQVLNIKSVPATPAPRTPASHKAVPEAPATSALADAAPLEAANQPDLDASAVALPKLEAPAPPPAQTVLPRADSRQQASAAGPPPAASSSTVSRPAPLPENKTAVPAPNPAIQPARSMGVTPTAPVSSPPPATPGEAGSYTSAAVPRQDAVSRAPQPSQQIAPNGDFHPPEAIRQVMPSLPGASRPAIYKTEIVMIKVSIDQNGKVVRAVPSPNQKVLQLLLMAAETAARQWHFKPARIGDRPVPSEMVVNFKFDPAP